MHEFGNKGAAAVAVSASSKVAKYELAVDDVEGERQTKTRKAEPKTEQFVRTQEDRFPLAGVKKGHVPNAFAYWAYRSDR
jgi:hypothetical protein